MEWAKVHNLKIKEYVQKYIDNLHKSNMPDMHTVTDSVTVDNDISAFSSA